MVAALLAPEIILQKAAYEFFEARRTQKELSSLSHHHWTLTQAFSLNMNGLAVLTSHGERLIRGQKVSLLNRTVIARWYRELSPSHRDGSHDSSIQANGGSKKPVNIPTNVDIRDRSEADAAFKLLTLAQALWFPIEVIACVADSLPITTLELSTCGLVLCAAAAQMLWWAKPQSIQVPREAHVLPMANDRRDLWWNVHPDPPFDFLTDPWSLLLFSASALAVGGIHCAALNFSFATTTEQSIWRVMAVLLISLPLIESICVLSTPWKLFGEGNLWSLFWGVMVDGVIPVSYALVRLFIIIETFTGLRRVPVEVYRQTRWADIIPHL